MPTPAEMRLIKKPSVGLWALTKGGNTGRLLNIAILCMILWYVQHITEYVITMQNIIKQCFKNAPGIILGFIVRWAALRYITP